MSGSETCGTWMPCTPISRRRRMNAGWNPGVRTIGVMPMRSAAITQACTSCKSNVVCSMSIKAASNPASPMISTICGSGMPPTWVPSASPPCRMMHFTRFSCIAFSRSCVARHPHPNPPPLAGEGADWGAATSNPPPQAGEGGARAEGVGGWGCHSAGVLADEGFHPLDRRPCVGRVGLAGHEAVIGAAVELQFNLATALLPALDQALHGFERHPLVAVAAEHQGRRQKDLFAAVEDRRRAGFAHRRLVMPIGVVVFDELGVAGLFRQVVSQQRVEHAPAGNDKGQPRVDLRRVGERQRGVARVVGAHRGEQHLMPAARSPHAADPIGATAIGARPRLQPARRQVDVGEGGRVGRFRRHAEIDGCDQDAALGQGPGDKVVVGAVLMDPGAAMHLDHRRVGATAGRPVEPRQQRAAALALVFDIFHPQVRADIRFERRRHRFLLLCCRLCHWPSLAAAPARVCRSSWAMGATPAQHVERGGAYLYCAARCTKGGWRPVRTRQARRAPNIRSAEESIAVADGSFARSAMRLVALFEALAKSEEGVSLAELSTTLAAPKSSLLGILRSMVALGYMEHGHGLYRLGPKSFRLAADILAVRRFPNLVRPILQDLAAKSGETVFLVVLDQLAQRMTYADIIDSANPVRYTVPTGTTRPLYVSAGGQMLLAYQEPAWIDAYIRAARLDALTPRTITDPRLLRERLPAFAATASRSAS